MASVFQITAIISTIVTVPRGMKDVTAKQVNFRSKNDVPVYNVVYNVNLVLKVSK